MLSHNVAGFTLDDPLLSPRGAASQWDAGDKLNAHSENIATWETGRGGVNGAAGFGANRSPDFAFVSCRVRVTAFRTPLTPSEHVHVYSHVTRL